MSDFPAELKIGKCHPMTDHITAAEARKLLDEGWIAYYATDLARALIAVTAERDRQYEENVNRIFQERQQELRAEKAETERDDLRDRLALAYADAAEVVPSGWTGEAHKSNMDYGPNVAAVAKAAILALAPVSPPSAALRLPEVAGLVEPDGQPQLGRREVAGWT